MSDVMLFGVLRMPYEMAMGDELSRYQFWQRVQEAADRLEAAEKKIAELESATPPAPSTDAMRDALTLIKHSRDFHRLAPSSQKIINDALGTPSTARPDGGAQGGLLEVSKTVETRMDTGFGGVHVVAPSTASEVGELPPLPSLPETLQNAMVDYRLAPQNDRASKAAVILAIQAYAESYARAALAAKPVAREVDVEAERKLYLKEFPSYLGFGWTGRQQDEFKVWLAARRTQEGAKDAERFRQAIACEDSAEVLYGAVLSHAPNGKAIRNEFDAAIAATQTKESQHERK